MDRLSTQARRRGIRLVGADTPENLVRAPGYLVDEIVVLPVHDAEACRKAAGTLGRVDAVLTFREMCVEATAAVADELAVAGNDPASVHRIRHKDLTREHLRAAGFAQPRSVLTGRVPEVVSFLRETGPGPWILKPRAGMGSAGVSLVRSVDDLPLAMSGLGTDEAFLVETFVSGREFSAEGVCVDGLPQVLAITEKFTGAGFVETGHRIPAGLSEATDRQARSTVTRALDVLGITRGIFHVEFWVTQDAIVIGELHARPGGDFIHALVEHSRPGLELYGALLDDLLHRDIRALPEQVRAAGVEYLALPPGRIRTIRHWDRVAHDPAVIAADLAVRPGDRIGSVASSADRHGVVVVGASTRHQVDDALTRLMHTIHIEIDP
jgi:biotin carboxylase